MANKLYEEESIQAIADSIRQNAPNSTSGNTYTVEEMPQGVKAVYDEGYENGVASVEIGGKSIPVVDAPVVTVVSTIDALRAELRKNGVTSNDICLARFSGVDVICQISDAIYNSKILIKHWQEFDYPYYSTNILSGNLVDPSTTIHEIREIARNQLKTEAKTITGAINELHDEIEALGENAGGGNSSGSSSLEMPLIRFVGLRGNRTLSNLDGEEYPVQFMVEIIAGSVQVGDALQICAMRTFSESPENPKAKKKLRRFAEYVITEDDLDKRFLTLTVPPTKKVFAYIKHNNMSLGGPGVFYFRIRRPKGEIQGNASGMTVDAKFSNVVPVSMLNILSDYQEDDEGNELIAVKINVI